MRWRAALGACAIFLLTSCDQTHIGLDAVKKRLRDPDSAKFTGVKTSGKIICGYVNSKNGFGGYAGDAKFSVMTDGTGAWIEGDEADLSGPVDASALQSALAQANQLTWSVCHDS